MRFKMSSKWTVLGRQTLSLKGQSLSTRLSTIDMSSLGNWFLSLVNYQGCRRQAVMPTIFLELCALPTFLIFSSRLGHMLIRLLPILNYSMFPLFSLQEQKVAINFLSLCSPLHSGTGSVLLWWTAQTSLVKRIIN